MKARSSIRSRITLATVGVFAVATSVVAVRLRADVWDKKTILTVNQPIQVEDTYLDPGTYVFKLHNSSSNRNIVHIYNRDEDHVINTILAIPNYRLQPTGDSRFTFYETPPGTAKAMRAWFYPGDNFGQEFRYPKQLRQIAMAAPPQVAARPPEPPPPPIVTRPAEPEPAAAEPPKREEPRVIARSAPPEPEPEPQAPPAPQAQPAPPATSEAPKELPSTASPLPLIGLGGLLSLAGYGILRIHRMT